MKVRLLSLSIQWLIDARSADVSPPDNNTLDVALALAELHECLTNDSTTQTSAFFVAHGMDVDDVLLDKSDTLSHLMNGYCANHATPACTEIARNVRSPVEMAIVVSEMVINRHACKELSPEHLAAVC